MLEKAIRIALEAHSGQVDLDGKPVILHPMNVAAKADTVEETIMGLLHDVVEDSEWTFEGLVNEGISEEIVDALRLLTHDKSEPYDDYVQRIARSGNRLAITTKLHDLQHNLARGRAGNHQKQVEKHSRALPIIEQAYAELKENE